VLPFSITPLRSYGVNYGWQELNNNSTWTRRRSFRLWIKVTVYAHNLYGHISGFVEVNGGITDLASGGRNHQAVLIANN
jgi:hypothetical protein